MRYEFNDGGRAAAGYVGTAGDCAVRAVAIATGEPYQAIYDRINELAKGERKPARGGKSSARNGVYVETLHKLMAELGWAWTATMKIGQGCTVHLKPDELPGGKIIVRLSKHFCAVVDGVIQDTHDPSRDGSRCVYGYWSKPAAG